MKLIKEKYKALKDFSANISHETLWEKWTVVLPLSK